MIIRIHVEDHGVLQLGYDNSKEQPFEGYGYGEPPVDNDTLHTCIDLIVADCMRTKINTEAKNESNS